MFNVHLETFNARVMRKFTANFKLASFLILLFIYMLHTLTNLYSVDTYASVQCGCVYLCTVWMCVLVYSMDTYSSVQCGCVYLCTVVSFGSFTIILYLDYVLDQLLRKHGKVSEPLVTLSITINIPTVHTYMYIVISYTLT